MRRWLIPEVIQTSNMDCGPAALKCILSALGLSISYPRLRDACQTDVDGTSIDALEDIALQLGLDADQVLVPSDHLFLDETRNLSAIVVVRLANDNPHFVVAWKGVWGRVQIMDPACGRRWPTVGQFENELYQHSMLVDADSWRAWAESTEFLGPLRQRMSNIGLDSEEIDNYVEAALRDASWFSIARLDAAIRLTTVLLEKSRAEPAKDTRGLVDALQAMVPTWEHRDSIPDRFWYARGSIDCEDKVVLSGAVLLKLSTSDHRTAAQQPESAVLKDALKEPQPAPIRHIARLILEDGVGLPIIVLLALIVGAGAVIFEAILFRMLIDLSVDLHPGVQSLSLLLATISLVLAQMLLEFNVVASAYQMGRKLEIKFRLQFLDSLPNISDRFFYSRPSSDMTDRCHGLHLLREFPHALALGLQNAFQLAATVVGLCLLYPSGAIWIVPTCVLVAGIPLLYSPAVSECDHRVRTIAGAMSRYYLEGLLGAVTVRTSRAEKSLQHEHEALLLEWVRGGRSLAGIRASVTGLLWLIGSGFALVLVAAAGNESSAQGKLILLAFWALNVPLLAENFATGVLQLPRIRNIASRSLEPVSAATFSRGAAARSMEEGAQPRPGRIVFNDVHLRLAGQPVLRGINLCLEPGEHIAVVGESGAGKSSIVGLLLGWYEPQHGDVFVGGAKLRGRCLDEFRESTAWVDPSVQLWNQSFVQNLSYGSTNPMDMGSVLERADLLEVLRGLPSGMQTRIGEGGCLLSGGEGQRVRFGRALGRLNASYVLLDEAFRGLSKERRKSLLISARRAWEASTLLFVTHDIEETQDFSRVLVVQHGEIIEDGSPSELVSNLSSSYSRMLKAQQSLKSDLSGLADWRHAVMTSEGIRELASNG